LLRCGPMVIVATVARLVLHADRWVWLIPLVVAAMVVLKWKILLGHQEKDEEMDAHREQPCSRR